MNPIYVCFNFVSNSTGIDSNDALDKSYQAVYKPIAKFLYAHPDFMFSFSLSGKQIQFFKKRRNELLAIFKQLIDRRQIEIIGGGYYEPLLPLLFSADRNGQIDLLSTEIRQTLGKRPRGISVFAGCWDSSLVNTLCTCGIEYILLESSMLPPDKRRYLPLIMSDLGKSVEIFPYYDELRPVPDSSPEEFVRDVVRAVEKAERRERALQEDLSRVVTINLTPEDFSLLSRTKFLESLYDYVRSQEGCRIRFSTPSAFRKIQDRAVPAYVPAGISSSIAKWIGEPFTENDGRQRAARTIYDFMETYPQSRSLYNRIMYVSMLVNQSRSDKMRKKEARNRLWEAQNGNAIVCSAKGVFSNSRERQYAYKKLMEAEKILRGDEEFKESVTCFDYDSDGCKEYVCSMRGYFSYMTLRGGAVQGLEVLKNTGNYVDNLSRVLIYDGCHDDYERGLFIDHVFTGPQFEQYSRGEPAGDGVFSRIIYRELKFSPNHHELQLVATACFPPTRQNISLRKKYTVNSDGMNVQYIIRNNSDRPFRAKFAVESNFAHTNFNPDNPVYYKLEAVNRERRFAIDAACSTSAFNQQGILSDVSVVRLTDTQGGIAFAFEPNEGCGFCYNPLVFRRPDFGGVNIVPVSMTFVTTLFWDIDIEPGMETEKNINFTITCVRKERKKL